MLFLISFNDKWLISFVLSREIYKNNWKQCFLSLLPCCTLLFGFRIWCRHSCGLNVRLEGSRKYLRHTTSTAAVTEFICSVKTVLAQFRHSLCLTLTLLSFQNSHQETFHWDDDKQYGDIGIKGYQKMVPSNGAYGRKWHLGFSYFSKELHKQKQSFEIKQTCTCQGKQRAVLKGILGF